MSKERDLSKPGILLSLALAVAGGDACSNRSDIDEATDLFRARFSEMVSMDLVDGVNNYDEASLLRIWENYFENLEEKDPVQHRRFMLQLKYILRNRKPLQDESDLDDEMNFLNFGDFLERLNNRNKMVGADGMVKFPDKDAEKEMTLADLTPDDEIQFEVKNPASLERMGMKADGPITCFRVKKETEVLMSGKSVTVKPGMFVVREKDGDLRRVFVHDGDRIIDSITNGFTGENIPKQNKAPGHFESFLKIKMGDFPVNRARYFYHEWYEKYEAIFTDEYKELLVRPGMPLSKHFVYFLQWSEENNIPPSEDAIRMFLDSLLNAKKGDSGRATGKKGKGGLSEKSEAISNQAQRTLEGHPDEDEKQLSYHSRGVTTGSGDGGGTQEGINVIRNDNCPLFAIVRLQGEFFDNYTYSRLTGNYTSRLTTSAVGETEYLMIADIRSGLSNAPQDIKKNAKKTTFAGRLNLTTTFRKPSDAELRKTLAFSHKTLKDGDASPDDFAVTYNSDGSVAGVTHNGKPYNPKRFITLPGRLRGLEDNEVELHVGGLTIAINLQDYFDHYQRLENARAGTPQYITIFDTVKGSTTQFRNPSWFVEDGGDPYNVIAAIITKGATTPVEKLRELVAWVQRSFDYQDEYSEINKLALAVLMDRGGDCEDSYVTLKTLANAIGLGDYVGAVLFEKHVAPILKGNWGANTYTIDGQTWTIVETATRLGKQSKIGETTNYGPVAFILPDGSVIGANNHSVPLKRVSVGQLDSHLVQQFEQALKAFDAFIAHPANAPKAGDIIKKDKVLAEFGKMMDAVDGSYKAIAATGKMAGELEGKRIKSGEKAIKFAAAWDKILEEEADNMRRLELQNAPEKFKAELEKYMKSDSIVVDNVQSAHSKIVKALKRYQGRLDDPAAMEELLNKLTDIINESGVHYHAQVMASIYSETLRFLPEPLKSQIKKDMERKIEAVNKGIRDPYNMIVRICNKDQER